MVKKGQHVVGLAIKDNIVKKAGEDGITIECISARLLKARIPIKSNFVTFVVVYAPTEEAPEGQKTKYISALNCTLASVPAREYVFVLTDANARTRKRGEGGGEIDNKVLGAYGRDKLNENGKLLLGFAEDNRLAHLMFVCVFVFFPSILDIKFVGRTSRGHTGGRSHRIFNPPSFCGACLDFCREKDSAIPFPRRP